MTSLSRRVVRLVALLLALAFLAPAAVAEDAYYEVPLTKLNITDGELPKYGPADWDRWQWAQLLIPYAVVEGQGEVFLGHAVGQSPTFLEGELPAEGTDEEGPRVANASAVAFRVPKGKKVKGVLVVQNADLTGMTRLEFSLDPAESTEAARQNFFLTKEAHYRRLADRRLPGSAWFRHQERLARAERTGKPLDEGIDSDERLDRRERQSDIEGTFAVFSGGRAISENLQLDRMIRETKPAESTVDIDTLEGITVAEMDWDPLVKDIDPRKDALAAFVPHDQHAVLVPSFTALTTIIDEAMAHGTPVLQILQPRSEDARSLARYQEQLCLSIDTVSRVLGPQVISSVACTGSDPYLRTGTDVAVLFQTRSPDVLTSYLAARHTAALKAHDGARRVAGEIGGFTYNGVVSKHRQISSYVATIDKTVVVTNSLVQLERIAEVRGSKTPALDSLPEFAFFRERYKLADSGETAFLVVTDATIRRWCGPKWRIATSRRTRAAAVMAEYQARHIDEVVSGKALGDITKLAYHVPELGSLDVDANGVSSPTYGTLEFQTPIAELELTHVTPDEAEAYRRWRNEYQRYWRQFFDPIAVRFTIEKNRLASDVTVMPLIEQTDYRQLINLAGDAKLTEASGDRHPGSLIHWAMAIDHDSELMTQANSLAGGIVQTVRGGPFSWLGDGVSVYVDEDKFWLDLAQVKEEDREEFMEQNAHRMPVAFQAEVRSSLKLAAFLTAIRAFVQQSAPDLTIWENKKHNGRTYVKIAASEEGAEEINLEEFAIYYAALPKSLIISPSEDVLKRAVDRYQIRHAAAKKDATDEDKAAAAALVGSQKWLGKSVALQVDGKLLKLLEIAFGHEYLREMQARSWANLPALNEWRRRYPSEDPLAIHQRLWQTKLVCPGGGEYRWNEQFQTMESTTYGHPAQPKKGPTSPAALQSVAGANFGVTFEHDGLRAKVEIDRK